MDECEALRELPKLHISALFGQTKLYKLYEGDMYIPIYDYGVVFACQILTLRPLENRAKFIVNINVATPA